MSNVARAAAPFTQPPLPYADTALQPTIGQQTVQLHYGKHHASYYANVNRMVQGTPFAEMSLVDVIKATASKPEHASLFGNAGQAWNHELYWEQMKPGGAKAPGGKLKEMIERDFGDVARFKEQYVATAAGVFGSGWAWLVEDGGKLALVGTSNGANPLPLGKKTLMGVDVWEHAYYLDYQNRRPDHVKALLDNLVNWDYVAGRL